MTSNPVDFDSALLNNEFRSLCGRDCLCVCGLNGKHDYVRRLVDFREPKIASVGNRTFSSSVLFHMLISVARLRTIIDHQDLVRYLVLRSKKSTLMIPNVFPGYVHDTARELPLLKVQPFPAKTSTVSSHS